MATTTGVATGATVGTSRRSRRSVNTLPLSSPAVILLFLWMIVPLAMTLWFSFQYYNLLYPERSGFAGLENYSYLLTDPSLWTAMLNTLYLVGWVLVITVGLGTLLAVLFDQDFFGRNIARLLAIAPVLRHADGQRPDLEEHADAPGQRAVRVSSRARSACR